MKPTFEYKGYLGSAELSLEDNLLVGRLLFIRDVVSYVAASPKQLEDEFKSAVDDYLETCAELGDEPDRPFKGSFNVRLGPDRHREVALAAIKADVSLNDWVCQAIEEKLEGHHGPVTNHLTVHLYGNKTSHDVATTGGNTTWTSHTTAGTADHVPYQGRRHGPDKSSRNPRGAVRH